MAKTRAQLNRAVRQEALREQLAQGGHLQHVIEMTEEISKLDTELDQLSIQRLKTACEIKLKLIDKYLPSLKAVEMSGKDGEAIPVALNVSFGS